jgi:hypothetical protein
VGHTRIWRAARFGTRSVCFASLPVIPPLTCFRCGLERCVYRRPQNVRHSRADGSAPGTMLHNKEKPNLPVSMYPDPEVAPNALVYHINDDIIYNVDIALYNG